MFGRKHAVYQTTKETNDETQVPAAVALATVVNYDSAGAHDVPETQKRSEDEMARMRMSEVDQAIRCDGARVNVEHLTSLVVEDYE